jgi:hypothetical protein
VGRHHSFEVDADELSPLLIAKNAEVFGDCVDLILQHQSFSAVVDLYSDKRQEMKGRLPSTINLGGGKLSAVLGSDEMMSLHPYIAELNSLVIQIKERLPNLLALAERTVTTIGPAIRSLPGVGEFPIFGLKHPSSKSGEALPT